MLRETDRFEVVSADGKMVFVLVEYRQLIVGVFGGERHELLGSFEYKVAGDDKRAVSPISDSNDEFIILPDDLRVSRIPLGKS